MRVLKAMPMALRPNVPSNRRPPEIFARQSAGARVRVDWVVLVRIPTRKAKVLKERHAPLDIERRKLRDGGFKVRWHRCSLTSTMSGARRLCARPSQLCC